MCGMIYSFGRVVLSLCASNILILHRWMGNCRNCLIISWLFPLYLHTKCLWLTYYTWGQIFKLCNTWLRSACTYLIDQIIIFLKLLIGRVIFECTCCYNRPNGLNSFQFKNFINRWWSSWYYITHWWKLYTIKVYVYVNIMKGCTKYKYLYTCNHIMQEETQSLLILWYIVFYCVDKGCWRASTVSYNNTSLIYFTSVIVSLHLHVFIVSLAICSICFYV